MHEKSPLLRSPSKAAFDFNPPPPLPLWMKIAYGVPSFPLGLAINIYGVYVFEYWTDYVGVSLEYLNVSYVIMLFWLLIVLPIAGFYGDTIDTKWGRRKPWILVATPMMIVSLMALFFSPDVPGFLSDLISEDAWQAGWFGVTFFLTTINVTLVQTPYYSLGVELTKDFDDRSTLFGYAQGFHVIGLLVATGAPDILLAIFPVGDSKWIFFGLNMIVGVIGIACFVTLSYVCEEKPTPRDNIPHPNLISGIRYALLDNKPFLALFVVITLQNTAPFTLGLLPFWVKYTLELNDLYSSILMSIFIAAGFIFIPFWIRVAALWGKRKAYAIALVVSFVSWCLMALPHKQQLGEAIVTVILCGMSGMFLSNYNFLYQSLQGDAIDYEEFKTGLRREAQYNNIMQFFSWFMSTLSTTGPFQLLDLLGFKRNQEQSGELRIALALTLASAGIFSLLGLVIFVAYFPISKQKHNLILRGLEQHRKGAEAVDPLTKQVVPATSFFPRKAWDIYWELYTFAIWEFKMANSIFKRGFFSQSPWNALRAVTIGLLFLWAFIFVIALSLWINYPELYNIVGYTAIFALCMLCYHVIRLSHVSKLTVLLSSDPSYYQETVRNYIHGKFFEAIARQSN